MYYFTVVLTLPLINNFISRIHINVTGPGVVVPPTGRYSLALSLFSRTIPLSNHWIGRNIRSKKCFSNFQKFKIQIFMQHIEPTYAKLVSCVIFIVRICEQITKC